MKQCIHHIFWFWLPPLGYMITIFYVSSLPNPQISGEIPDYVLHALEYFLLTLLLIRLLLSQYLLKSKVEDFQRWHLVCLLGTFIAIAYGITDEFHQYFVPNRHCSLHDVAADTFGAFLAYMAAMLDYWLLTRTSGRSKVLKKFRILHSISYISYWFSEKNSDNYRW
ncbi:VanZ family protein [Candidatus Vecturithrix granuli]|uniref:VanZ family protein n=1 Tax=Vecturithrix granuli TaxID=1499967 RepID=A0A081BZN4_VECG1|nr:VanZ family protein [Candidatus Vecturithrix granuli]